VNVDDPSIERRPARDLDPDSDLLDLPVTVAVGKLPQPLIEEALDRGFAEARRLRQRGLIDSAALSLRGCWRVDAPCLPERSEGSSATSEGVLWSGREVLRYAQDDEGEDFRSQGRQ